MALKLIKQMSSDESPIFCCSWNPKIPDNLVTGDLDGIVRVWNLNSGGENQILMTAKNVSKVRSKKKRKVSVNTSILSVALHPDGDIVAIASLNGYIKVTRISDKKECSIGKRMSLEEAVCQLQFSPQGTYLAGVGGKRSSLKLWSSDVWDKMSSIENQELLFPPNDNPPPQIDNGINNNFVASVAWNPSGTHVACGTMVGSICVFDVREKQVSLVFNCSRMAVTSLVYSPLKDNILVWGSHDASIHVYDLNEKKEVYIMRGHSKWVLCLAMCPDGKTLASGSCDKNVLLWDIETGEEITEITKRAKHSGNVCDVKFIGMEDGENKLATVSFDGIISLYKYCGV